MCVYIHTPASTQYMVQTMVGRFTYIPSFSVNSGHESENQVPWRSGETRLANSIRVSRKLSSGCLFRKEDKDQLLHAHGIVGPITIPLWELKDPWKPQKIAISSVQNARMRRLNCAFARHTLPRNIFATRPNNFRMKVSIPKSIFLNIFRDRF